MKHSVNVAVIGAGYWGKNIIRNFANNQKTNLVLICDSDNDRAVKLRDMYSPGTSITNSVNDVMNRDDIDAVSIVTPVYTHFDIASAALRSGKHVLIEKPMSMLYSEASKLVRIANDKNLNIMCDHTFCYSAPVRKIRELIQSGEIGQLLQINSSRCNLGLLQTDVNVLWDLAPHDISIVNYVTGQQETPTSVRAYGKTIPGYNHEVDAMMSIEYKSGLHVNIHNSWLYPVKTRKMSFVGTKKMIMWDDLSDNKVQLLDKGVDVINHKKFEYYDNSTTDVELEDLEPLALMVDEFVTSIIEDRNPLSSGVEGLKTIQLLESAKKSINRGSTVLIGNKNDR